MLLSKKQALVGKTENKIMQFEDYSQNFGPTGHNYFFKNFTNYVVQGRTKDNVSQKLFFEKLREIHVRLKTPRILGLKTCGFFQNIHKLCRSQEKNFKCNVSRMISSEKRVQVAETNKNSCMFEKSSQNLGTYTCVFFFQNLYKLCASKKKLKIISKSNLIRTLSS